MTTTALPTPVLLELRQLRAHDTNIRTDLGDLTELTASIRELGVRQPLWVVAFGRSDLHRVVDGHRRLAAARLAGAKEVPCIVRTDLGDPGEETAEMLTAALARPVTALDEADGYARLVLDMDLARAATRTGRKQKTVRQRLRLAAAPETVRGALRSGQLTLEQALAVDDFADDPDTYFALCEKAGTADFPFALQKAADTRARAARVANATAALVAENIDHGTSALLAARDGAARLSNLDGVDPATHATCPGHYAVIDQYEDDPVSWWCTRPALHDTTPEPATDTEPTDTPIPDRGEPITVNLPGPGPAPAVPDTDDTAAREVAAAAADAQRELLADLATAATVRTQHLADQVTAGDPDLALRMIRDTLTVRATRYQSAEDRRRLVQLLGLDPADAPDNTHLEAEVRTLTLPQAALLLALIDGPRAQAEHWLTYPEGYQRSESAWWCTELTDAWGYEFSDVESALLAPDEHAAAG